MSAVRAAAPRQTSLLDEILNLLSNVLFPVVVFLIWSAATTVGTVVKQNLPPQQYYDEYPQTVANVIVRLHLTNVFHSIPYITLVVLLLVSMAVCTFRRVIPKRFPKDRAVTVRNFALHAELPVATRDPAASTDAAAHYLSARGFKVRRSTIDGAEWLFGDKQKWARYGVLVAHLGFTVIALGVFLGWWKGYSGQILLYRNDSTVAPHTGLRLTLNDFHADFIPVITPNGTIYQASKFQSDVSFTGDGLATTQRILVNHPYITPDKTYFYQASYTFGGNLRVTRGGKIQNLPGTDGRLSPQDAIFLPGTSRAIEYGTLLGPSDPSQTPPGIALPTKDEYALWIFHDNIPTTARPILLPVGASVAAGDGFVVTALPPTPASGLTYRYDPGQYWVGLGCIILVAGFAMALFFVPVKIYMQAAATAGGCVIACAATTTKGNTFYEDEFNALVEGLKAALSEPHESAPAGERAQAYA